MDCAEVGFCCCVGVGDLWVCRTGVFDVVWLRCDVLMVLVWGGLVV